MAGTAAVSATIIAPNTSTQDDNRISTSEQSLSSLRDFLVPAPDPSRNGSAGSNRAPKRRKLASGKSFAVEAVEAFDKTASALLKNITVDFVFPTNENYQSTQVFIENALENPKLVLLYSFQRDSTNGFSISLLDPATQSTVTLSASASGADLDRSEPHLDVIASLGAFTPRKNTGACFCRCLLTRSPNDRHSFQLVAELRWLLGLAVVETAGTTKHRKWQLEVLAKYFTDGDQRENVPWQLSDFYGAVHVPKVDAKIPPQLGRPLAETSLYPFQKRALNWLLRREGVTYPTTGGSLIPIPEESLPTPVSFQATVDAAGKPIHVSHLRGAIVSDLAALYDSSRTLRGGILAEEMGLGKTVELIALISHNKRKIPEGDIFDAYTGTSVKPSGATLIISPPSLLEQWMSELETHAPDLKVKQYSGIPAPSASRQEQEEATVENLMKYDVVLSTYSVLAREIHFANPPPDRFLRHAKKHEARKSPLVQMSWWRVCLDEAQMVESGVSHAATVARMIPRCNAWAVSGTPFKNDIQDLRGLLIFLRYEPFAGSKALWERLDKQTFCEVFGQIALRHTKDKIRSELRLPPQKRVVITVPFTTIEEQHYQEMLREMCETCGLAEDGQPLQEDWDPNDPTTIDRMRGWLMRLRQTCLHANVGKRNRKALGGKGPLRTVQDVLEAMIDQNDTLKKSEAREYILAILRQGHVIANDGSKEERSQAALPYYHRALIESQSMVEACRKELMEEQNKLGKTATDREETDNNEAEETANQNMGRIPAIRKSLRSFLELEHACKFFIGTAYYQMKTNDKITKPDSEQFQEWERQETYWYEKAKDVRKELLKESQSKAQKEMDKLSTRNFHEFRRIDDLPDLSGIEGAKIWDMFDNVCDLLRDQAAQLEKWRKKVVDILLLPLVDEEKGQETTGDEYEDSTKVQDELYVYIMALRTLVADRNTAVNGLRDILVNHELRAATQQALKKEGHAPELVLKFVKIREKLEPSNEACSLKGVVAATRSLLASLQWNADDGDRRAAVELAIVQRHFSQIQGIAAEEAKGIAVLEKELELFRGAMNLRLDFYRQLQHISDTVASMKEELDEKLDRESLNRYMEAETTRKNRLDGLMRKEIYLANLREENDGTSTHECRICLETFDMGVMVACGHKFCKECLTRWWQSHRTCPLCKVRFHAEDLTEISLKPTVREETPTQHPASPGSPSSSHTAIYSDISENTLKEIKMIDLNGSYGSKIDMIARHLLWIRQNDPGSQSIIFSQFGDFLDFLRGALTKWGIGCSSISQKNGIARFKSSGDIECFLLDAKSNSSGLSLVNATYVFLCEPLINPAIELQAIARVHRIGQQRPTTVFMYLISDTVEEAIYDISVARRLAHMGHRSGSESRSGTATPALLEKTIEAADSKEVEAAPLTTLLRKKGEGEMVQSDDLWGCLFGKPRKRKVVVLNNEVNRHLRAEAAASRRQQASTSGGTGQSI